MKKIALLLAVLITLSLSFTSCKDDEESKENLIPETYAKKWVVDNKKDTKSVEYISIELTTDGYYFIIFDDNTCLSGTCYLNEDNNIVLVGYGYIEIMDLEGDNFSFVIHVDNSNVIETVFTTAAQEMEVTPDTDLLCKTWDITEYYFISDNDTTWAQPSSLYNFTRFEVTFTTYGTYFTSEEYTYLGTPGEVYDNRYWKWTNDDNDGICYGLTEASAEDCIYSCEVTTLTEDVLVLEGTSYTNYGAEATYYIKGVTAN